jgi:hypothetical protein
VEANELSLIGAAFVSTFLVAFIFGAGVGFWVGVNDKDPATILHEQTLRTEADDAAEAVDDWPSQMMLAAEENKRQLEQKTLEEIRRWSLPWWKFWG